MKTITDWLRKRREQRQWVEETLVAAALREQPDQSGYPLAVKTGLGSGRILVVLARMETDGRVTSRWADEPKPRRRLYRLARATGGVVSPGVRYWVGERGPEWVGTVEESA
jgi:hypothetical protein